jgi:hypothetical protein
MTVKRPGMVQQQTVISPVSQMLEAHRKSI